DAPERRRGLPAVGVIRRRVVVIRLAVAAVTPLRALIGRRAVIPLRGAGRSARGPARRAAAAIAVLVAVLVLVAASVEVLIVLVLVLVLVIDEQQARGIGWHRFARDFGQRRPCSGNPDSQGHPKRQCFQHFRQSHAVPICRIRTLGGHRAFRRPLLRPACPAIDAGPPVSHFYQREIRPGAVGDRRASDRLLLQGRNAA